MQHIEPQLIDAGRLARRLRVPAGWLRAEAEEGRIPGVRAGSTWLFDARRVERILAERAARGDSEAGAEGGGR